MHARVISHPLYIDKSDDERVLKDFDLDYAFGPSYGECSLPYSQTELDVPHRYLET